MSFDTVFDRVIGVEKGYVNDPNDPGGETNFGISKRSYPDVDIKNLTRAGAKAIYLRDFWKPLKAASLRDGVAFQLFDFAVNSGVETATRALQRAIGVADDGDFGPIGQTAEKAMSESDVIMLLLAERLEFMTRLKNWPNAGKGWARRIVGNLRYASTDTAEDGIARIVKSMVFGNDVTKS